jgi:hypothetical protein
MAQGRKFTFPEPGKAKLKDRAVFCTSQRILALYNQAHGEDRQKITITIKRWFATEARKSGWAGGHFLPEIQTAHTAGCVLFVPPSQINVAVTVTAQTLVLLAEEIGA